MPQAPEGQAFGKYQLLDRLAAGGMAEIYRAKMTGAAGMTKPVVIKKILPHFAGDSGFISQFINEAQIAGGLSHGNIAQVFDFGEVDGEYFLAMEFVDGQPLSRVLRRAKDKGLPFLPAPMAVLIAQEICQGLAYAHTRRDEAGEPLHIIHRDVNPQNVIISYEGQVKLVDFGIAKARLAGRMDTVAGAVKGKYVYFSPEQAQGEALDSRTDIFAAGVVLYQMLCGRLPFPGKMVQALRKLVKGQLLPPRDLNPDLAPDLERVLLTALAHNREERFDHAERFAEALASYLHTSAPHFFPSAVAYFMSYLFEEELKQEGRALAIPPEFAAQIENWRRLPPPLPPPKGRKITREMRKRSPPPQPAAESSDVQPAMSPLQPVAIPLEGEETVLESLPESTLVEVEAQAAAEEAEREEASSRLPHWTWLGVPLLGAVVTALLVVFLGGPGTFSVELSSQPSGAHLRINGKDVPTMTPALISELDASKEHLFELTAPGRAPWSQKLRGKRGEQRAVHAELRPSDAPLPSRNHRPRKLASP